MCTNESMSFHQCMCSSLRVFLWVKEIGKRQSPSDALSLPSTQTHTVSETIIFHSTRLKRKSFNTYNRPKCEGRGVGIRREDLRNLFCRFLTKNLTITCCSIGIFLLVCLCVSMCLFLENLIRGNYSAAVSTASPASLWSSSMRGKRWCSDVLICLVWFVFCFLFFLHI